MALHEDLTPDWSGELESGEMLVDRIEVGQFYDIRFLTYGIGYEG